MDALVSTTSTGAVCIQACTASLIFCDDVVEGPRWGIGATSGGNIVSWYSTSTSSAPAGGTSYVLTGYYLSGGSYLYANYVSIVGTGATFSGSTNIDLHSYSPSSTTSYVHWLRTRAYPPSGVMPTVSIGSLV